MQSVCKVRSRLEGFLGRFFLVQLVFWLQALSGPGVHGGTGHHEASWGLMAAQDITRLHEASWRRRTSRGFTGPHGGAGHHEASRGFMAAQDITAAQDIIGFTRLHGGAGQPRFWSHGQFGHSFSYSFSNRIFLEQLCFSIDSSILHLLLPMLPRNP